MGRGITRGLYARLLLAVAVAVATIGLPVIGLPVIGPAAPAAAAERDPISCGKVYEIVNGGDLAIYTVDTVNSSLSLQNDIPTGAPVSTNSLAIDGANDTFWFINSLSANTVGTIHKLVASTGVMTTYTGAPIITPTPRGNIVMGAFNPESGIYYYGQVASATNELYVYGFNTRTNTAINGVVGRIFMGSGSNGDFTFDTEGRLYIANNSQLFVLDGAMPTTGFTNAASAPLLPRTQIASFASGVTMVAAAFGSDGYLYLGSLGEQLWKLDPSSGAVQSTRTIAGSVNISDFASCANPSTITLRKSLPSGRSTETDQFGLSITGGGLTIGNTATTSGTETGVQDQQRSEVAGPVVGLPGGTYTVGETGAGGTSLGDYTSSWACVNQTSGATVASGTGTGGSFQMPNGGVLGANIECTITNLPDPANVSVTKTLLSPPTMTGTPNRYTVTYRITVASLEPGGPTRFDLTDDLGYGPSATVVSSTVARSATSTDPPGQQGTPGPSPTAADPVVVVTNERVNGNERTEVWDVTTVFDMNYPASTGANTDCSTATGPAGTGSRNTATLSVAAPPSSACAPLPSVQLDKQPGTVATGANGLPDVGEQITWPIVVTNNGSVALSGVAVTDPSAAVTCPATTLAVGASMTCTAARALTQADLDAGSVTNIATVRTAQTYPVTDTVTTPIQRTARYVFDKAAGDPVSAGAAGPVGDTIAYTFVLTNTGNVPLSSPTVTDPKVGAVSCPAGPIAPGGSVTCTASYTVTQADADAGSVVNVATPDVTPPPGVTDPPNPPDSTVTPLPSQNSIDLTKVADPATASAVGDLITYTFTATNTGQQTLSQVTVSDPLPGLSGLTCTPAAPAMLAPGAAMTCTASRALTQADVDEGSVTNTAIAEGTPPGGAPPVTDLASAEVTVTPDPGLELTKVADPTEVAAAGDTVTYTFTATNTGNVTLNDVAITDPLPGLSALDCDPAAPARLAPGGVLGCTATYTVTQADVNAGAIENTATAAGTTPGGDPVEDTDTEQVTVPRLARLTLDKSAGAIVAGGADGPLGDTITYSFAVTNTGNVPLDPVAVTDAKVGAVSCPAGPLAPGATTTCTAAPYVLTQADVDAGEVVNTATATGSPPTGVEDPDPATDTETVPVPQNPAIELTKVADPTSVPAAGEVVTYTFTATNTGDVTLADVEITDPLPGLSALDCTPPTPAQLAPAATLSCTATYTVTQADADQGTVANTATVAGTDPSGDPVEDSASALVTVPADPEIALDKQAGGLVDVDGDGPSVGDTITYSFVVTNTGNVTLDPATVDDPKVGPVTCPAGPLAPGASVTCDPVTYPVTLADLRAGSVQNQATATGRPPSGDPVTSTDQTTTPIPINPGIELTKVADPTSVAAAGEVVTYTFTTTNTGNVTLSDVAVSDPLAGLSALTCDPAAPATLAPGAVQTCTATKTVTQAEADAGKVDNTATASGTDVIGTVVEDEASATVTVPAAPAIDLVKTVDPTTANRRGDTNTYTFIATNTGNVTLSGVAITDPLPGLSPLTCTPAQPAAIAPGETLECTATRQVTQADVNAGEVLNEATATGEDPNGTSVESTDDATVTIDRQPHLTLEKTADPTVAAAAGQLITYTFVATNDGNVTIDDVAITDPLPGLSALECAPVSGSSLDPDESMTCTATKSVTQAEADAGEILNTATATGLGADGTAVEDTDDAVVQIPPTPELSLDKQAGEVVDANLSGRVDAGDTIDYTFVVTNTGNVTLDPVTVTDDLVGEVTCPAGPLAPGDQVTCTAEPYVVSQVDVDAGKVDNTATATGTPPTGEPVPSDPDSTSTPLPATPALTLVKTAELADADGHGKADVGETIQWTFEVTNTGNVTLTQIVVSDPMAGSVTCTPTELAPGASSQCTADKPHVVTQADVDAGSVDNVATASGTPPNGPPVPSEPDETSTPTDVTPKLELVKTHQLRDRDGDAKADAGEKIDYTFVVTNTGTVTISDIAIDDPMLARAGVEIVCAPTTLAPGAKSTCSATYTVTAADEDSDEIVNVATAGGCVGAGADTARDADCEPIESGPDQTATPVTDPPTSPGSPPIDPPIDPPFVGLPDTGGPARLVLGLGLASVLAGAVLLATRRLRKTSGGR